MNPPDKKSIFIVIQRGSELRVFLYSGLCERLSNTFNVVVASDIQSTALENYCKTHSLTLCYNEEPANAENLGLYGVYSSISKWRLMHLGAQVYSHKGKQNKVSSLKTWLLGNLLTHTIFQGFFNFLNSQQRQVGFEKNVDHYQPFGVVMLNAYSQQALKTIFVAKRKRLKIFVVQNSLKDFYINPTVSSMISIFFAWSDFYSRQYRKVNRLNFKTKIVNAGYLPYRKIKNYQPVNSWAHYCVKYSIPMDSILVYYTAINPAVYSHEQEIISAVSKALKSSVENAMLVIRPNPMGVGNLEDLKNVENVRISKTFSVYDVLQDHLILDEEADVEFYDLLYFSSGVVNIPSTVTVEALLLGKPVLNICFDASGDTCLKFKNIYDSEFYEFLKNDMVKPVFHVRELTGALRDMVKTKQHNQPAGIVNVIDDLRVDPMDVIESEIILAYNKG